VHCWDIPTAPNRSCNIYDGPAIADLLLNSIGIESDPYLVFSIFSSATWDQTVSQRISSVPIISYIKIQTCFSNPADLLEPDFLAVKHCPVVFKVPMHAKAVIGLVTEMGATGNIIWSWYRVVPFFVLL